VNIVDPILFQCRINAGQPAICAPGENVEAMTYAQLESMLNTMTRAMLQLGLKRGEVVGVLIGNKILHIVLFLALARIGVVTVSCRGRNLPKELGAVAVVTETPGPFANVDRIILVDREWTHQDSAPLDHESFVTRNDELCRIVLTSGSTGVARGVALTHGQIFEKYARLDYTCLDRWSSSERMFCDLGLSTSLSFYYLLYMLSRGGMILLMGENQLATLQALNLFGAKNMATAPYGLAEYLKFYESQPGFRCGFDYILVGGGAVSNNLVERVWARMCPNLFKMYGATEMGPIALTDARATMTIDGAAGFVLPGVQVQIADESGKEVRRGKEGIVRVRADQGVAGYYGNPAASAAVFRNGWFYPGDIGYLRDDNLLVVSGRQEALINVGGDKINPEILEERLVAFPAVADCAVVNIPNELGIEEIHALVVPRATFAESDLRKYCAEKLRRALVPVRFIAVEKIPRNDMAKIERGKLAELVKANLSGEPTPETRI
jgi:acyl-coenzyme A synthetase/AMP-(fatty) acid ligase